MRARRRSWFAWSVPIALAGIAAIYFARAPSGSAPVSRFAAPDDAGEIAEPSPTTDPSDAVDPAPARTEPRIEPPPVSALAPPGCGDDEPDPPGFVRPSVWELLRERTHELRDRLPQLSRDASPALRQGLNGIASEHPEEALDGLLSAPDRVRDGFDVALAARVHVGMRELAAGDHRAADRHARAAIEAASADAAAHALASLAADALGESARARASMRAALALAPDEPALALAAAQLHVSAAELDPALRALDVYLAELPADARVRSYRERVAARELRTRAHARRSAAGVDVLWPRDAVPIARIDEVSALLRETLEEVARLTHRARRAELAVLVYTDRAELRRATCAPSWTGAVFDGVLHLDAQTLGGADWERVIRHEATHAQLARIRGSIPHWLDEGLAQWIEGPPSPSATAAWARMVRERFWIPFASLEGRLMDIDDPRDAALAYFQSLAMVLYLIERRGRGAIAEAAAAIEAGRTADLLEHLLPGAGGDALLAFLAERAR